MVDRRKLQSIIIVKAGVCVVVEVGITMFSSEGDLWKELEIEKTDDDMSD